MFLFFVYPVLVLILAVLVVFQPTGSGAFGVFGSGGGGNAMFSVRSSKGLLSRFTIFLICIFFIFTFLLSGFYIKEAKTERDIISRSMRDEMSGKSQSKSFVKEKKNVGSGAAQS